MVRMYYDVSFKDPGADQKVISYPLLSPKSRARKSRVAVHKRQADRMDKQSKVDVEKTQEKGLG